MFKQKPSVLVYLNERDDAKAEHEDVNVHFY